MLPFVDSEMIHRLQESLKGLGVQLALGHKMTAIEPHDDHVTLTLNKMTRQDFDIALIAAGRQGNTQTLGLEQIGVELGENGLIVVNEKYQTNIPNIFAAGDVIGFPALASTSMEQARFAVTHAFGMKEKDSMPRILLLAVYSIPEISMVGLTEDDCKAKRIPHLIGRSYYKNNPRGQIIGDTSGMVKLIFSPADRKLLGAHIIGEGASELIHIAAHVMLVNGTIDMFVQSVYNYPTLADLYKSAAYDGLANWEKHQASINGS